ncbi:hypothetical protein P5673_012666 [Acropora cervicornis]|uniref:MHD2 domain-containing protein n=1 Tax=Acropora cervicornis TaxID=6130 RepID=A0AAD9V7B1_ACRCE|nr:hypothetical protein P5673_012666 [Acropora cervicornis]
MTGACAWSSDKDLVPEDQIKCLLSLLFEAEKRKWEAGISPVNSLEPDNAQTEIGKPRCSSVDTGSHLLGYGQCVTQIHSFFHDFEPRRYCLKATTNRKNLDRPSSQMKVVSDESLQSSITLSSCRSSQELKEGFNPKSPSFELCKNALLCAKFPVLSLSQTECSSTLYSATLSPSMQQKAFSFSKVSKTSSVHPDPKANSPQLSRDDCVSPEVSFAKLSEDLQTLVTKVFQLKNRDRQYVFERVPRAIKDSPKLLVETLLSQKAVLEHNNHPFYRVNAFLDKNAYSEWVMLEKDKIEFESSNKEVHQVHHGVAPSSPLSENACRLLQEFQLRFGIGTLFSKISHLKYFVDYLPVANEVWYMEHVRCCLKDVMDNLNCPEIFVESEFKTLVSILSTLLRKTEYALTKDEMKSRYERLKVIALDELNQDDLSAPLMIKLVFEIRHEVKQYNSFYNEAFSSYFDVMERGTFQFYSLLMSDIEQLCENPSRARKPSGVEPDLLCLAFRLSNLDKDWSKFIPFSLQKWRGPFKRIALQWLDAINHSFRALVPQMISCDSWTAAELDFHITPRGNNTTTARREMQKPCSLANSRAGFQSLPHSQLSAFNTVRPSSSLPVETLQSATVSIGKGKSQSTKGSSPVPRAKSPKRPREGMLPDSSSGEETLNTQKCHVVVQIHSPKSRRGCRVKDMNNSNSQDETPSKLNPAAHAPETNKDNVLLEGNLEAETPSCGSQVPVSMQEGDFKVPEGQDGAEAMVTEPDRNQKLVAMGEEENGSKIGSKDVIFEPGYTEDSVNSEKHKTPLKVDGKETKIPKPNNSVSPSNGSRTGVKSTRQKSSVSSENVVEASVTVPVSLLEKHGSPQPSGDGIRTVKPRQSLGSVDVHVSGVDVKEDLREDGFDCNLSTPFENESTSEESESKMLSRSPEMSIGCAAGGKESPGGLAHHEYNREKGPSRSPQENKSTCAKVVTPVEHVSVGGEGPGCYVCERCPTKDICPGKANKSEQTSGAGSKPSDSNSTLPIPSTPINIPPRYPKKLITRLRDNPRASVGSAQSAASFFTAAESIESFHSARSKISDLEFSNPKSKENSVDQLETLCNSQDNPTLNLSPNDDQIDKCPNVEGKHEASQVVNSFVKLYSDSILAMETCGLQENVLTEVLDERLQRYLKLEREAGHLQGCRYDASRFDPPCEEMLRAEVDPRQFEPLTQQQMGVRISNVAVLRNILPWLCENAVKVVDSPASLPAAVHHGFESSVESLASHSFSYCEYGPRLDDVTSSVADARCNVSETRMSKFLKPVLSNLLNIDLPRYDIRKRLKPALHFLTCELRRFHSVLYPDCFNRLLNEVWVSVAEMFKEELSRLEKRRASASKHCELLLEAEAYLMKFFHAENSGLGCDEMSETLGSLQKDLQLYTLPTDKLITLYDSYFTQYLRTQSDNQADVHASTTSVTSHRASAPADSIFQALRKDLHTIRKCFSGAELVEWLENYVRENGLEGFGSYIGSGVELGQYMLEQGIVTCVTSPPLNQQPTRRKRNQDEPVFVGSRTTEKGKVYCGIYGSSANSSRSSSRSTTKDNSESENEADDECEDDDVHDFLGSGSDVWARQTSVPSKHNARFFNNHDALYKFVCEEDSRRSEIKFRLGIRDRQNLWGELRNILCVLYTRKGSDRMARDFLKKVPTEYLNESVGYFQLTAGLSCWCS